MAEKVPAHPTERWARRMASMARAAIGEPSPVAREEAMAHITALETALIEALRAIDNSRKRPPTDGGGAAHGQQ